MVIVGLKSRGYELPTGLYTKAAVPIGGPVEDAIVIRKIESAETLLQAIEGVKAALPGLVTKVTLAVEESNITEG